MIKYNMSEVLNTYISSCMCKTHIEVVDGPCHVELIHGVDNDGGSGEEGEQQDKKQVDRQIAHEPAKAPH